MTNKTDAGLDTGSSSSSEGNAVVWEYLDDADWKPCGDEHQHVIENAYQRFNPSRKVQIKSGHSTYEVDIKSMTRTNMEHVDQTKRNIRRLMSFWVFVKWEFQGDTGWESCSHEPQEIN